MRVQHRNRRCAVERRFSRRAAVGGTLGLISGALVGCGGDDDARAPTPSLITGSPVAIVPEFEDPTRWAGRTLRVAAWGGEVQAALREMIWRPFARATGCQIQEVAANYDQFLESVGAGQPYADLMIADEVWAETAPAMAAIEPVAESELLRDRFGVITATDLAIPAYAYALVNVFRRELSTGASGPPQRWADWWDENRYDGRRSLPRGAFGSLEFALLADGVDRDDLYPLDIGRAIEVLRRITDKIGDLWWNDGLEPVAWLSNQRVDLAAAWHYRAVAGQLDGRAIEIEWNQGLLVADCWVIGKGTTVRDVAVDFVRYATTPAVQAALARVIPLGPVTPAAFDLISPRTVRSLPTAPQTIEQLIRQDRGWWAVNQTTADEQFACNLLGEPCGAIVPTGTTTT